MDGFLFAKNKLFYVILFFMKAVEYFKNGCSCSESIMKLAIEKGLCPKEFFPVASAFSGGMSSGCLCGTIASVQMISGFNNPEKARANAKYIVEEFKKRNKFTCCRVLSAGFEGMAKKEHCSKYVLDAWEILESVLKVKV